MSESGKIKVVFIGAGNLATQLSVAMKNSGYEIIQIFSKREESARQLGELLSVAATTKLCEIDDKAELYIFSVKDSVLKEVIRSVKPNNGLWVHTAGSIYMDVFQDHVKRYGVFYPLQTFSKTKPVDFCRIPFFIEAHREDDRKILTDIAQQLSECVIPATSEQRKYVHLSAVFASNFVNHMYAIAEHILKEQQIPFDVLAPLIQETAEKIKTLSPEKAQTGPAVRYDVNVMENQCNLLHEDDLKKIYTLLSDHIHLYVEKNKTI